MAASATLHCLTGCAIGEIAGLMVGTALGLSIATMEVVDNLVMLVIPGAMGAGIVSPLFWVSMASALAAAFFAAYPVNRYLLSIGKGHALTHQYHHDSVDHKEHAHHA